jgi:SWI/SNF-related matrix-associated actin-dependent regulator 1 of chromatin subfamily A
MTALQRSIYMDALQRSRKTICEAEATPADSADTPPTNGHSKGVKKKPKANARPKDKMYLENSSNVLMDLRKAASHPMLFRTRFTDDILSGITKRLLKEPDFKKRGALYDLVKEDMTVMTDAELQVFCATYKVSRTCKVLMLGRIFICWQSTRKYLQGDDCYLDAGKVQVLMRLLAEYGKEGRKVLIFSQV